MVILRAIESYVMMPGNLTRGEPFHGPAGQVASVAMHEYQLLPCEAIAEFPAPEAVLNFSRVRLRIRERHQKYQVCLPQAELSPLRRKGIAFKDDILELIFLLVQPVDDVSVAHLIANAGCRSL